MDQRRDSLAVWAASQISRLTGVDVPAEIEMVSGDASFRRYFRLRLQGKSWVCVDAPADKEDNPKFVRIAQSWRAHGVHVPEVIATEYEQGFMLLEDFGDEILWPALHADSTTADDVRSLYQRSIDELIALQKLPHDDLPVYDDALLRQEMALFPDWLCERQLGLLLSETTREMLKRVEQVLVDAALSQPTVVVHRDFHSRNLMLCADNKIGVIDFQDAVAGPVTYDLISILRDCYVRWPDELVSDLVTSYWQAATGAGIWNDSLEALQRAFDLMGMQRHLKAAGIFARLNLRDGKAGYMKDIPNTCRYLRDVAGRYPEFAELCTWLDTEFLPVLANKLTGSQT